jgi:hypothetical protein
VDTDAQDDRDEPVSLAPLNPAAALRALLSVKADEQDQDADEAPTE